MTKKARANKLLILVMGVYSTPHYKEVEFDFDKDDLRVLKTTVRNYRKTLDKIIADYHSDETMTRLFGQIDSIPHYQEMVKRTDDILKLLNDKPPIIGTDDFKFLCNIFTNESIDAISKTHPGLISCLANAVKIYYGIDDFSKEDFDEFIELMAKRYSEDMNQLFDEVSDKL